MRIAPLSPSSAVGFIGTGVMGLSMAEHLLAAGHPLTVTNRSKEKAEPLLRKGARWATSAADVALDADVVITMVGLPSDVDDVYFGERGVFRTARAESIVIDMTTSSPKLARRIHAEAGERGVRALDAPVSGGDAGARAATLSIMVGGTREDFEAATAVLRTMGTPAYQGPAGSGQNAKLANQMVIASTMVGVCEALAFAARAGLEPTTVLATLERGAAASWLLSNLGPKMLAKDFAPGFYVRHFVKDMKIAIESADEAGLDAPGLKLAASLYERLVETGGALNGTQALYRLYTEDGR